MRDYVTIYRQYLPGEFCGKRAPIKLTDAPILQPDVTGKTADATIIGNCVSLA
jgi:hypothetical protein